MNPSTKSLLNLSQLEVSYLGEKLRGESKDFTAVKDVFSYQGRRVVCLSWRIGLR